MGRYLIQQRDDKTSDTNHTKKQHYTTARRKTTANYHQQFSIGRIHQPIKHHPHKIPQTV